MDGWEGQSQLECPDDALRQALEAIDPAGSGSRADGARRGRGAEEETHTW